MNIKRAIYISGFVVLGILVNFLVHATVEIWYINRLLADFNRYSLGFSWDEWVKIHNVGAIVLFVLGAAGGYGQGKYWWRIIYVENRLRRIFPFLKLHP